MSKSISKNTKKEYKRGFLVSLFILGFGTLLEIITGDKGLALPSWPMNIYAGISFAVILIFIHVYYKEDKIVRWLSRVPASISSIVLFSLLTLILGLTRQNNPDAPEWLKLTGLSSVQRSYTFLFSGLYLLTTLGLVTIRRMNKLTYRNAGFLLNHLGLWIIVFSGSLGAGDLKRINIFVNEGEEVWYGFTGNQQPYELPFRVQLEDFDIDFFPPKLAMVETGSMKFPENLENNLPLMEEGMVTDIGNWNIEVENLWLSVLEDESGDFIPSEDTAAMPVAKISAVNLSSNERVEGFISSGSIMRRPIFLKLNERFTLAMAQPEPREYSSELRLTASDGEQRREKLVVNKPVKIDGWNLYQVSYDERMGRWSRMSVIEAIRDPWLPVIYTGIYMVIAGALYLFSIGKSPKKAEE